MNMPDDGKYAFLQYQISLTIEPFPVRHIDGVSQSRLCSTFSLVEPAEGPAVPIEMCDSVL